MRRCSSKRPPTGGNSTCKVGSTTLPDLGTPFLSTGDTVKNIYGPFPQGYLKLVKGNLNVEVGALPTLVGAEYTFSFENMNIERGLLWNQENAVNRGIQLNDTYKKLSVSFSWNDGFYSNPTHGCGVLWLTLSIRQIRCRLWQGGMPGRTRRTLWPRLFS